ncbi:MAG: apolipoprotein N-acyltransferase [Acidobacteriota bacterium]
MKRYADRAILLAGLAGLLMALSFPLGPPLPITAHDGWWPIGWCCLAPLILAAAVAPSALCALTAGFSSGVVAYGLVLSWLFPFLVRWGGLQAPVAFAVLAALVAYVAGFCAIFALCVWMWSRRWGLGRAVVLAPAAWTGLELVRAHLLTGFPWSLLGYSQYRVPAAIQVADLTGIYGVSFVLVCASGIVALICRRVARQPGTAGSRPAGFLLGAVVGSALLYGVVRPAFLPALRQDIPVALVQTDVAQAEKWDPAERARIEREHFEMTRAAGREGAKLVIWSESSVPVSITADPGYATRLRDLATETGAEIVVGSVAFGSEGPQRHPLNSAFLVRPGQGVAGRYDKRRLVPFGEYVPLKKLLFFLQPLVEAASDFHAGTGANLLASGHGAIGPLICYDAIFPGLARDSVREGAQMLVNISNDAWYAGTAMPYQDLAQSALRAVECRRYLLRSANVGFSAFVDPSGVIVQRGDLGRSLVLKSSIGASTTMTPYVVLGDVFAAGCAILTAFALALASQRVRRKPPQDQGRQTMMLSGGKDAR